MTKNADMPASPLNNYSLKEEVQIDGADEGVTTTQYVAAYGLTKRERFAGEIMAKIAWNVSDKANPQHFDHAAETAVQMADALLDALEKGRDR